MANRQTVAPEAGETRHGPATNGVRGSLYLRSATKTGAAGNPSCIVLDSCDTSGTVKTWALWVDSTGDLRIVEVAAGTIAAAIADEDGSGTVVGAQS